MRNAGNSTDGSLPFSPGDFGPRGLTGDGRSKSLLTGITPVSINLGLSGGLSLFVNGLPGSPVPAGTMLMGVDDGVQQYGLQWTGSSIRGFFGGNGVFAGPSSVPWGKPVLYSVSRKGPGSLALLTNGVLAATSTAQIATRGSRADFRLFAASGPGNQPINYFGGTLAFAFLDDGTLTPGDYAQLNAAIRNWLTAVSELP